MYMWYNLGHHEKIMGRTKKIDQKIKSQPMNPYPDDWAVKILKLISLLIAVGIMLFFIW
jgi:hypothetical protein